MFFNVKEINQKSEPSALRYTSESRPRIILIESGSSLDLQTLQKIGKDSFAEWCKYSETELPTFAITESSIRTSAPFDEKSRRECTDVVLDLPGNDAYSVDCMRIIHIKDKNLLSGGIKFDNPHIFHSSHFSAEAADEAVAVLKAASPIKVVVTDFVFE